jgi:hypothetical protein
MSTGLRNKSQTLNVSTNQMGGMKNESLQRSYCEDGAGNFQGDLAFSTDGLLFALYRQSIMLHDFPA